MSDTEAFVVKTTKEIPDPQRGADHRRGSEQKGARPSTMALPTLPPAAPAEPKTPDTAAPAAWFGARQRTGQRTGRTVAKPSPAIPATRPSLQPWETA